MPTQKGSNGLREATKPKTKPLSLRELRETFATKSQNKHNKANWMTVREAAADLNTHANYLYILVRENRLRKKEVEFGSMLIDIGCPLPPPPRASKDRTAREVRRLLPDLDQPEGYEPKWATVSEAAAFFGCSRYVLYHIISAGHCRAKWNESKQKVVDIGGTVPKHKKKAPETPETPEPKGLRCSCCRGKGVVPCRGGEGVKVCPVCKGNGEVSRVVEQVAPTSYLNLLLNEWELEQLEQLAEENCRDPHQQARWILKQALRQGGAR